MSGGRWEYTNDRLSSEMFGWRLNCVYGDKGHKDCLKARDLNPMGDREISELVWDVLCLINARDYYESGDIGIDTYNKDLEWFKEKWFDRTTKDTD